ncbi:Protein SABRE [Coemansia erecta]|nr:Protein SABRE [Coemansia erecta]
MAILARYFLSGFGLRVRGFNGTSARGLMIKARVRRRTEIVFRVDEIGFDIRTMRRLRIRVRNRWAQFRCWLRGEEAVGEMQGTVGAEPDGLSKRIQLYARGVRIQLMVAAPASPASIPGDGDWWPAGSPGKPQREDQARPGQEGSSEHARDPGEHMSRVAKKISTILRSYTYIASLFAWWIDICVTDARIMIMHSGDMARAGHGITLHVGSATMWAESASGSPGRWRFPWRRPHAEAEAEADADADTAAEPDTSSNSDTDTDTDTDALRGGPKYKSTLAVEFKGLLLSPGIDGAQQHHDQHQPQQQHVNSRWELVKALAMQDMLAGAGDSGQPHVRGPVVNCQQCTVRSDMITTFWGLPKRIDQRAAIGQTHVRAGALDALLDEISIMRLAPTRQSPSLSFRSMRALNNRLAMMLNSSDAPSARPAPGQPLFLLHELLSRLRLEHVSIALRLSELVADLPLAADSLVVDPPAMLRWRQRGIEAEAGYRWTAAPVPSPGSTAYTRAALGSVQVTALRVASMTPDMRAEEQHANAPGLRLRECTVHGEMFAFLSEDLSSRPNPQPTVYIDVNRPELVVDLRTQLAFDAAQQWIAHMRKRLRDMRSISSESSPPGDEQKPGDDTTSGDHLLALLDLIFSEVKLHFTVERAVYSVQPGVMLDSGKPSGDRINLSMQHLECHLHWALVNARTAAVEFRTTSSPAVAQWNDDPARTLLQAKRGVNASGGIEICIASPMRVNTNVDIDVGDVSVMLREHEFRAWLAMQPLWLAAQLANIATELHDEASQKQYGAPSASFILPPIDDRRKRLTATVCVQFKQLRATIMACDNDEDVCGKVEHGTQICLASGAVEIRANGGSIESPHPFGFRDDAARVTLNIECQRAVMFLLSAVAADKARPETTNDSASLPSDFAIGDLCGHLPDSVQQHILLIRPKLKFSRRRLEPHRARMIIDLQSASFTGVTSVSSVYRWSVFMHHIRCWQRRKRLARRIITKRDTPDKPDDILVSIGSDVLDLRGDLVSPVFFDLDRGFQLPTPNSAAANKHVPQLKFKIPHAEFSIEKTQADTDNDLLIALDGPIATLYGDQQPLLSLSECKMRLRFPRKVKRAEMAAEQGVRGNSTYSKIDIAFARGALAFGYRYNMAETIDGYALMQKACKRIARKSSSTCFPPMSQGMLAQGRPTRRQVMAALGNPQTFVPPPLRELSTIKPPPPPCLREPDDIPTIDFHGPEFTVMVHDDPFETALAQIYQTGLAQQRERLSRLEAFEAKAQELRAAREHEIAAAAEATAAAAAAAVAQNQGSASDRHQTEHTSRRRNYHYRRSTKPKSRSRSKFHTAERLHSTSSANLRPGIVRSHTLTPRSSALASASMHDVSTTGGSVPPQPLAGRPRTNSVAVESPSRSTTSLVIDEDNDACSCDDVGETPRTAESVDAEIDAAFQRLMQVEASEWIRAIRQKMVSPVDSNGEQQRRQCAGFDEIFDTLASQSDTRPPYMYRPASWTHPPVPLGRLVMSPMWIKFDTPLSLLEFKQVEKYLRYLDPATPHKLEWSTLVPMRMRVRSGDIRMQLRDFPFPLFRVPDPYRQEAAKRREEHIGSYDELRGGFEVSGSLVLAERTAHERSLRSVYIPIGPRARDTPIDVPNVGWYMAKSLQFPRIFTALSIMLYSVGDRGETQLPQLPIMSAWGACYQPVISALMQRLESATSKSADVSPSLPWWDKLRSRLHFKSRMAVVDAFSLDGDQGQMFFLALDGRDPYQVTQKPGSYLFTMRGGVRLCLNEGIPGNELWDKASGRGIYSVPTEESAPPSATLSEFMRLRCDEFLMGVPIIIDRQTQIMQFMEAQQQQQQQLDQVDDEYVELLRSITSDNNARYTFVTHSADRLYYKVLLHLSGGVRLGIGLSSYIPPDRTGMRHNHWEVHPIAPEAARAMAALGISDAYTGYRSTRLHTSISLLCPFVDPEHTVARPFADMYLTNTEETPRLRDPDERVRAKPLSRWSACDIDALVSPMHSLFTSEGNQDLFFAPFPPPEQQQHPENPPLPADARMSAPPQLEQRASASTQCRISATEAVIEGVKRYLPLFVARMMLPVRKGTLYPFTEPSDNKIGKCLRSMRLVLHLKSVELAYSQRDYEIKELETRELDILGDQGLSPTPSDMSGSQPSSAMGAKAEGIMRELKARVKSFSFNMLLEQSEVKIRVGSARDDNASPSSSLAGKGKKRQQRNSAVAAAREAKALRWGIGDASLEIDYLDVRLTQLSFMLPLFKDIPLNNLPHKCQQINGLWFLSDTVGDVDQSWISRTSIRDLKELDINEAIFSDPSVVCVLWSPRLVYFTQRPGLPSLDPHLEDMLCVPTSPLEARRSPLRAEFSAGANPMLQRSLSAQQRERAASDLRDPMCGVRPYTGDSIGSEDMDSDGPSHRRNTSMPWPANAGNAPLPPVHPVDTSAPVSEMTEKSPVSAMTYKSSFHLLGLARTRQRRLTASTSRNTITPKLPNRGGSELDLVELQRQASFPIEQTLTNNSEMARMIPTGPDPKVIMRDSRSTQAMLLEKRKEMLGAAIAHEQASLEFLSGEFEQASSKYNEKFRREMVRRAEHIYELGARRKLINRCLRVLGFSTDAANDDDDDLGGAELDLGIDREFQEVEKALATMYRHRCLIYSGYLIWTTQVRDKLMRFLYIQDCLTAIEYYMSESAANVVRKATSSKGSTADADSATARSRSYSEAADQAPQDSDEATEQPHKQSQQRSKQSRKQPQPSSPRARNRSGSQASATSTSSRRTLRIPKLLRRLRSQERLSSSASGTTKKPKRKEGQPKAQSRSSRSKYEKGLAQVWDDLVRYRPYHSLLVEFLNPQVSLRVDEDSKTSAIAVAERVQLHRILLCNDDDDDDGANEVDMAPPSDESVVKARSMVELENVQVFTTNRSDFENQVAYFVDCTYGSQLHADVSKPTTLWPAWIPIELLLSQGRNQVRSIFEELEAGQDAGDVPGDGESAQADMSAGAGKAWWIEDLNKYKRLMNRNSGMVVYDKANPLRIQSDTADSLRPAVPVSVAVPGADGAEPGPTSARSRASTGSKAAADVGSAAATAASVGDDQREADDGDADSVSDDNDDPIDDAEATSSEQGLSHRANHISVFLPELNLACTAEQYTAVYETVTELLVFIDPEKAAYMDHLNTIQLGMDMSDIRGLLSIIRATQTALRERIPIIYDWYSIQRSRHVLCGDTTSTTASAAAHGRQRAQATALLTLDRHRRALELQLRTAMDLFGAAQKQMRRDTARKDKLLPVVRRPSSAREAGISGASCSSSSSLRAAEGAHNTIARTIHLYINKATWHMLENDEQPLCDVTLRWASLKAVTTSDQATHLLSEVHLLYIVNRLPDPMFTDLVGPYIRPKHATPDFCVEKMIRVQWSELAPVGGISIVERFEVDLFPLRLQLSHDIAQKLMNYLYPPQEGADLPDAVPPGSELLSPRRHRRPTAGSIIPDEATPESISVSAAASPVPSVGDGMHVFDAGPAESAPPSTQSASGRSSLLQQRLRRTIDEQPQQQLRSRAASEAPASDSRPTQLPRVASGLLATISGRTTPLSLMENSSMLNISQSGDNRTQVDEMKKRASSNKTFLQIKIGGSTLCISYQGRRANNITDLRDFEFHAPMLELRNQVESYFELLMQVKKEYMSVAVQHTGALVKEKFRQLHNRKAWSKSSFGPDWDARRLLIDMDRVIDEEMSDNMRGSLMMTTSGGYADTPAARQPTATDEWDHETVEPSRESSVATPNPPKNKAPLSKYMILDPRKLMGKRLPRGLGQSVGQSEPPPSPRLRGLIPRVFDDSGDAAQGTVARAATCDPSDLPTMSGLPSPLRVPPFLGRRFTTASVVPPASSPDVTTELHSGSTR